MNNGNTFTVLIFRLIGGFLRGENENRARPEHLEVDKFHREIFTTIETIKKKKVLSNNPQNWKQPKCSLLQS